MDMTERRKQLLERMREFRFVPGHGPRINEMTDDQLEETVKLFESMFKKLEK